MTGKEALRRFLEAEDVKYVFGNPGSTEIPLLDVLAGSDIEFVLTLHEGIAVAMADGYARASGRPAVVAVHACPGTAQALGLLYNAKVERAPVVVLAGQQDSRMVLREPFLSADLARLAEQFTKWSWEASRVEDLPVALRRAFKEATVSPAGPVLLSLPKNVLDETTDVDIVSPSKYRVAGRLRADPSDIRRAAEILAAAEKPVFIVGTGVVRSGAVSELVDLAEMVAARVYGDPSSFPTGHTLCFGAFERRQIASIARESDVLFVVGTEMFSEFTYSPDRMLPADVKTIHFDADSWEIAKNTPIDVGIVADPKAGLRDLVDELRKMLPSDQSRNIRQRLADVGKLKDAAKARLDEEARSWSRTPLHVGLMIQALRELLSDDAIIVEQAIESSLYLKKYFEFRKPGTYYTDRGGTLGWVLGAALGVKLAEPRRQVVAFAGDGSLMFTPQALWTAAQRNIPVTVLVINNGGYMATKALSLAYGAQWAKAGKFIGADIDGIDYPKLAESLGVSARRIVEPEDITPTLKWGLELGRPALIEVVVDPRDAGYGWPRLP